ncbi:hypothetical protein [Streptomyces sp. S.PB5]|uniref:hypothetical protein n=1 Tax=Streptomyces sp. S.PB5 TaxID=3020844 RepID=UPI0025B0791A|nr:hypothetical protein [Streptomyces sp. S.PB5]MDN3023539.1 hypothetical protein [Streptomyces sp. S.PB5]
MSSSTSRIGALCGVLAGLLTAVPGLVEAFTGETSATGVPLAFAPAVALPLLIALHQRQDAAAGSLGRIAIALNLTGLGLFGGAAFASNLVLFHFDEHLVDETLAGSPTVPVFLASATVFAAGCALFGTAMIRARVFPRLPSWSYAVVLPLFAFLTAFPESLLTSSLHVVVGVVLIRLSVALWGMGDGEAATSPVKSALAKSPQG